MPYGNALIFEKPRLASGPMTCVVLPPNAHTSSRVAQRPRTSSGLEPTSMVPESLVPLHVSKAVTAADVPGAVKWTVPNGSTTRLASSENAW